MEKIQFASVLSWDDICKNFEKIDVYEEIMSALKETIQDTKEVLQDIVI